MLLTQTLLPIMASLSGVVTCNVEPPAQPSAAYYTECEYREGNTAISLTFSVDYVNSEDREPLVQSFGGYNIRNLDGDIPSYIPIFQELMDRSIIHVNEILDQSPRDCFEARITLDQHHRVSFPSGFTQTGEDRGGRQVFEQTCS